MDPETRAAAAGLLREMVEKLGGEQTAAIIAGVTVARIKAASHEDGEIGLTLPQIQRLESACGRAVFFGGLADRLNEARRASLLPEPPSEVRAKLLHAVSLICAAAAERERGIDGASVNRAKSLLKAATEASSAAVAALDAAIVLPANEPERAGLLRMAEDAERLAGAGVDDVLRLFRSDGGAAKVRRPSAAEIEAAKSPAGGFSRATLAAWGVPWPPPKGWRKRLENGLPPVATDASDGGCTVE